MEILKFNNVYKYFGDYKATNNVSFSVNKGAIFGLLGPNGAGKTTIIRQITNIYMPDEGEIKLFGEDIGSHHQNMIGYLPEERGLYKKLKVIEQLIYFAELKGLSKKEAEKRARVWLIKFDAADLAEKKVQELSKGMQQKIQFIGTILHEPEFIILDEPFSGFDPVNAELLKDIILDLREQGKTVILSTHVMSQVEQLCEEIILINRGQLVLSGKVRDIKKSFGRQNLKIEFEGDSSIFDSIDKSKIVNKTLSTIEIKLENEKESKEILNLIQDKLFIYKFELAEPSLHEIFIKTVGKDNLNEQELLEIQK
jgi:ABC-2 type transport system ATP-binding protein